MQRLPIHRAAVRTTPLNVQLIVAAACLATCALAFAIEGRTGFNLWDEGFLWYGVQRVLTGEVPIRDFMAYNPGRYYWAAGLLHLSGAEGVVAVRAATALFGAIGIAVGTLMVLRASRWSATSIRIAMAGLAAVLFLLWMVPWWKSYDSAISMLLVASLAALLARPDSQRFFLHGIVVGLTALFGRNHGIYALVACLLAVPPLLIAAKPAWLRCIPAWCLGVVLGFLPMLLAILFDARFASMFFQDLQQIIGQKGATLPIPVPWPWAALPNATIRTTGLLFVALVAFAFSGAIVVLSRLRAERTITHPVFVAAAITAIPYLNVAFSRADVAHLAQAIFPLLIGALTWPWRGRAGAWANGLAIAGLALATVVVALPQHPGYQAGVQPQAWRQARIQGDTLRMPVSAIRSLAAIQSLVDCHVPPGRPVLAAPVWPGAYASLSVKSPVWEIYPLVPRDESFEQAEIERLRRAAPALVLIKDVAIDRRQNLRYANSHPLIWRYLEANFKRIDAGDEPDLIAMVPQSSQAGATTGSCANPPTR